nr:hypothetical protein [Tanacetum cinerariifolium]
MSSASSAVTYTFVYTDSVPGRVFWGADEELSDGVPQDEDEREPMFIQPHDPDYVPEPMYLEYIPLEDEHVLSAETQPLPPIDSPTAESSGYVKESDLEKDPEEYEDDETEDGSVDYPIDGGDNRDDDDDDSSRDGADYEDEDEEDEKEEHLALADSAIAIPTVELVSLPEGTEPAAISLPPEVEVERLLAMPTLPPSPLTSLLPPSARERLARDNWVDPAEAVPEISPMTVGEVNTRVTKLAKLHEHDTQDLFALLEDAQDSRTRISQRVTIDSQRMQQAKIAELRETGRRHQAQMVETLRVMGDMRRKIGDMQAELLALREQPRRARQPGEDTRVPNHQDAPRDADGHI